MSTDLVPPRRDLSTEEALARLRGGADAAPRRRVLSTAEALAELHGEPPAAPEPASPPVQAPAPDERPRYFADQRADIVDDAAKFPADRSGSAFKPDPLTGEVRTPFGFSNEEDALPRIVTSPVGERLANVAGTVLDPILETFGRESENTRREKAWREAEAARALEIHDKGRDTPAAFMPPPPKSWGRRVVANVPSAVHVAMNAQPESLALNLADPGIVQRTLAATDEAVIRPVAKQVGSLAQSIVESPGKLISAARDERIPAEDIRDADALSKPEERGIGPFVTEAADLAGQAALFHAGTKLGGAGVRAARGGAAEALGKIAADRVPLAEPPLPEIPTGRDPAVTAGRPASAVGAEGLPSKLAAMAAPTGLEARLAKAGLTLEQAFDAAVRGREGELDLLRPADRAYIDGLVKERARAASFPKKPEMMEAVKEKVSPPEPELRFRAKTGEPEPRVRAADVVRRASALRVESAEPPSRDAAPTETPRAEVSPQDLVRAADEIRANGRGFYSRRDAMQAAQRRAAAEEPAEPRARAADPIRASAKPPSAPTPRVLTTEEALREVEAVREKFRAAMDRSDDVERAWKERHPDEQPLSQASAESDAVAAPPGRVERIPVASIEVDPALQFKRVTDERTGTGKRLRDVDEFDPEKGGVVAVWRDPETGATKIINGFHRLELAQRAGAESIDVRYIQAADANAARAKGALINIAEGAATPLDVAAFLRESGLRGEDARAFLREHAVPLTSTAARDGLALSRLEDGLFDQYARGELRESVAAAIADSGLDDAGQRALAAAVTSKGVEAAEIPALARRVQGAATTEQTTASLFGDVTEGRNLFALEAKVETQLARDLARDKRLFGSAARNAGTLERGGNVIDVGRSSDIAARSAQVGDVLHRLSGVRGPVADAISAAAKAIDAGETTLADAVARARIDVEDAVRAELGPRAAAAPSSTAPIRARPEARVRKTDKLRAAREATVRPGDVAGVPKAEPRASTRTAAEEPGLFESGAFDPEPRKTFGTRGERGSVGVSRGGDGPTGEGVSAVARGVSAIARGAGDLVSKLTSRSIDFLRKQYGEAGEELAQRIQDVQSDARARAGRDIQELNAAVKEIPIIRRSTVSRRLRALVEGREQPRGGAEAKLVDTVRRIFDRVAQFANESGVRIDDERSGPRPVPTGWRQFFPQLLKGEIRDALRRGDAATIAKLRELNVGKGKAFATAEEMDAALQRYFERRPESFHPGTELPRRFHYPDEWVDPDGLHIVLSYIRRAYANAAEHRWFEFRDPATGAKGQGVLGDLYARIEREFGHADAAEAKTLTERILGRHVEDSSRFGQLWKKAQGAEGLVTAARLFVGNLKLPLQQVTQLRNLTALVGEQRAGQGLWRTATRWKKARDLAVREGAVQPESTVSRTLGTEDLGGRMLRKGHEVVSAGSFPIAKADAFWRTVASEASPGFAEDLIDAMQRPGESGGGNAAWATRTLQKLDMTPSEVAEFRAGAPSERTLTKFRQRVVSHSQVETTTGDRPVFFTHPGTQWLARLKSFGIGDARFAVRFAFSEAAHGNFAPLARYTAWTVASGEALNAAYSTMFGPRADRPSLDEILEKKDLGLLAERLVDDLKTASFFGTLGSLVGDATPDEDGKTSLGRSVEHLVTPPIVDTVRDAAKAYDRGMAPKNQGRDRWAADRANALEQLVRDQVVAVKQVGRAATMATPEGVRREMVRTAHNAPGSRVSAKDRPEYLRDLREREEFLRSIYEAVGAGK